MEKKNERGICGLYQAIKGQPTPPCEMDCDHYELCASREFACESFFKYVSYWNWERLGNKGKREPSKAWFIKVKNANAGEGSDRWKRRRGIY